MFQKKKRLLNWAFPSHFAMLVNVLDGKNLRRSNKQHFHMPSLEKMSSDWQRRDLERQERLLFLFSSRCSTTHKLSSVSF